MSSRLALGTVQFGIPYGVANCTGQVGREAASAIIAAARAAGIDTLDTAASYGESERRLGEIGVRSWRVVSKLPTLMGDDAALVSSVRDHVRESTGRLGVPRLYAILVHRSEQLLGPTGNELYRALASLKDAGEVEKIGVSIYGPEELERLWPRMQLDLVQTPFNVVDRRIVTSGWLERLCEGGTEVHARSLFLQGLLLMTAAMRPARFQRWQRLWDEWHDWLHATGLSPLQACLRFAASQRGFERLIVGVDSCLQLEQILHEFNAATLEAPGTLSSVDPELINPSLWSLP